MSNEHVSPNAALKAIRNELNEHDAEALVKEYRAYLSAATDAERVQTYSRTASVMFDLLAEVMPHIASA